MTYEELVNSINTIDGIQCKRFEFVINVYAKNNTAPFMTIKRGAVDMNGVESNFKEIYSIDIVRIMEIMKYVQAFMDTHITDRDDMRHYIQFGPYMYFSRFNYLSTEPNDVEVTLVKMTTHEFRNKVKAFERLEDAQRVQKIIGGIIVSTTVESIRLQEDEAL